MIESLPPFIKGMELCERFYREAVRPLLDRYFPGVTHSAAKIDQGSEVLGFDTAQSRDHHWGPKVMLFVAEQDYEFVVHKDLKGHVRGITVYIRWLSHTFCDSSHRVRWDHAV